MPLTRVLLLPLLVLASFLAPVRAQPADADTLTLPFQLHSNKIYLDVNVNGTGPYPFVLDTGAPMTVLDWDLGESLNIPIKNDGLAGGAGDRKVKNGAAKDVSLSVGALRFRPTTTQVVPLHATLSAIEGREVRGLIGGDLFDHFVVELDFQASVIKLHPTSFEYHGPGAKLHIKRSGHIFAHATIEIPNRKPITGDFLIDTGARVALSLATRTVKSHKLISPDIPAIRTTVGWGLGGPLEHSLTRATRFTMGDFSIDNSTVTLSQDKGGVFAASEMTGLIGTELLKRCHIVFDYPRDAMYLEPIADAVKAPVAVDSSGLFIISKVDDFHAFTVKTVVADSPAQLANIAVGDQITAINDTPAADISLEQLRKLLMDPDRTIKMKLMRDDQPREAEFTTKRLI